MCLLRRVSTLISSKYALFVLSFFYVQTNFSDPTSSHAIFQKEESANLIHVIESADVLDNPTVSINDNEPRPNLVTNLSQSSTGSQSRSSSSQQVSKLMITQANFHNIFIKFNFRLQVSMDSEDIRVTSGDVASVSMSSAASISSSCSSAGIAENDNMQSKQFSFSG